MNRKFFLSSIAFSFGFLLFYFAQTESSSRTNQAGFFSDGKVKSPFSLPISDPHQPMKSQASSRADLEKMKKEKPQDILKNSESARRDRSVSSREQWDENRNRLSDFTLYFIDRHPREVAEELINAYR